VERHLEATAKEFGTDFVTIKSSFRKFLNEGVLSAKVAQSGDGWWHGFQHGLGIIGHAAPVAYLLGKKTVYIASSFTVADKGKVTCASDPSIDNYVRFCGVRVVHDGYEFTRQMKVHNITRFAQKTGCTIPLRVCWESMGGSNCCNCEKCWRTIMAIYAEGFDPHLFGFDYTDEQLKKLAKTMRYGGSKMFSALRYTSIQTALRKNNKKADLPRSIRWFYDADMQTLGQEVPLWLKAARKCKRALRKLLRRGH
jgi:hypothetical protein